MSKVFDWVNSITYTKKNLLSSEEVKDYNPFITNKSLSYHLDCLLYANEMNMRPNLDKDMQYLFLFNSIRKRKRYSNWEKKIEDDNLKWVKYFYSISSKKAFEILDLLSKEQLAYIKNVYENINF